MPRLSLIEFEPVTPLLFSWRGSYTWIVTGPSATPGSKPFPLPSTVVGALIASMRSYTPPSSGSVNDVGNLYDMLAEHLGGGFRIRGPAILATDGRVYVDLDPANLMADPLCIPDSASGIGSSGEVDLCLAEQSRLMEPSTFGVALRSDSRSTIRHMIYSVRYAAFRELVKKEQDIETKRYSIAVEVFSEKGVEGGGVLQFGGDRGVARVKVSSIEVEEVHELCKKCAEGEEFKRSLFCRACTLASRIGAEAEKRAGSLLRGKRLLGSVPVTFKLYTFVLSPLPIEPGELEKLLVSGVLKGTTSTRSCEEELGGLLKGYRCGGVEVSSVGEASISITTGDEIWHEVLSAPQGLSMEDVREKNLRRDMSDIVKAFAPRASVATLGYDMARGRPRWKTPVIMPSSLITVSVRLSLALRRAGLEPSDLACVARALAEALYISGVARSKELSRLGWGTILPLKLKGFF